MLEGERVVLRPIQASDRERLYELVETIEVRALAGNDPPLPLSLEEIQARDERRLTERRSGSAWFAIDVDGETIGEVGLHSIDHYHQRAEVGMSLGKPYWGRGHGQDAVRTLVDYGFRHLNLTKISLQSSPTTNGRSVRIGKRASRRKAGSAPMRGTTALATTNS